MVKAVFLVLAISLVVAAIVVLANYTNGLNGKGLRKTRSRRKK